MQQKKPSPSIAILPPPHTRYTIELSSMTISVIAFPQNIYTKGYSFDSRHKCDGGLKFIGQETTFIQNMYYHLYYIEKLRSHQPQPCYLIYSIVLRLQLSKFKKCFGKDVKQDGKFDHVTCYFHTFCKFSSDSNRRNRIDNVINIATLPGRTASNINNKCRQ